MPHIPPKCMKLAIVTSGGCIAKNITPRSPRDIHQKHLDVLNEFLGGAMPDLAVDRLLTLVNLKVGLYLHLLQTRCLKQPTSLHEIQGDLVSSDLFLLGNSQGIINLDAQVPQRRFRSVSFTFHAVGVRPRFEATTTSL